MKKMLALLIFAMPFAHAYSQPEPDRQKARQLKDEAIRLMDNGDPDKAIVFLDSAQRLDPDHYDYLYEIGYARYIKKEYAKAIEIFQKTTTYPDVTDQCYQMLGNAYDMNGERSKAREAYAKGLKQFPAAGRLYMESGLLCQMEKKYDEAVALWENGIKVEPDYSSNYYRLAKLFAQTDERIWAIFYGELFMNIERGSERTAEMSKLLFGMYKMSISFPGDTSNSLKLDMTSSTIRLDPKKEFKIPFRIAFTGDFIVGLAPLTGVNIHKKEVTLAMLNNTRVVFVNLWFDKHKNDRQYPNILLDFHRLLKEQGWLEAYNYWLLSEGAQEEFIEWRDSHTDQYAGFIAWFKDHPLHMDTNHLFLRTQYD